MSQYTPRMDHYTSPVVRDYSNSTSFDNNDSLYQSVPVRATVMGPIYASIFGVIIIALIVLNLYVTKKRNSNDATDRERDIEAGEGESSLASKISKMNPEERMALYSEAFDKNKHQIVMEASSIIKGNPDNNSEEEETHEDGDSDHNDGDDDRSIYLALKDARAMRRSIVKRKSISGPMKRERRRSSIIHPRNSITATTVDIEAPNAANDNSSNDIVRGNCVICFENIEAGDTVVWSETKSCPHVYHKDCMVAYLAHKKQSIKEIELDENPCPTCRQKFVTVCIPVPQDRVSSRTSATSTGVASGASSPVDDSRTPD